LKKRNKNGAGGGRLEIPDAGEYLAADVQVRHSHGEIFFTSQRCTADFWCVVQESFLESEREFSWGRRLTGSWMTDWTIGV
jgi:hypothetical protein